jgi:hypothetical protein
VDWKVAFDSQPKEPEWLIPDLIECGTLCAIFGKPDAHKSLFVLELCLGLVREGRTVVYIDQENGVKDIVDRLTDFGATPAELGRLNMYSFPELPPLDTPLGGLHLKAIVVTRGADIVILDTTGRMVQGSENDADTFNGLYRCTLRPLKALGVTSLRIDHPGKDAAKGQRGSSAKDGDADLIWLMTKVSEKKFRLDRHRDRRGHSPLVVELDFKLGPLRHERSAASRTGDLEAVLDAAGIPADGSRTAAREVLKKHGIRASNQQLGDVLHARRLRSAGTADHHGPADQQSLGSGPSASVPKERTGAQTGPGQAPFCAKCGEQHERYGPFGRPCNPKVAAS